MKEITEWKLFAVKQLLIALISPVNVRENLMNSWPMSNGRISFFPSPSLCQFQVPELKQHISCRLWVYQSSTFWTWISFPPLLYRICDKRNAIQHWGISHLSLEINASYLLWEESAPGAENLWAGAGRNNSASYLPVFKVEAVEKETHS